MRSVKCAIRMSRSWRWRSCKHTQSDEVSPALKQVIDARKEIRDQAREELVTMLADGELKQLELNFTTAVDEATAGRTTRTQSPLLISFRKMSRAIILDR